VRRTRRLAASCAEVHADAIDDSGDRLSGDKTDSRVHDVGGRYHDAELSSGDKTGHAGWNEIRLRVTRRRAKRRRELREGGVFASGVDVGRVEISDGVFNLGRVVRDESVSVAGISRVVVRVSAVV